MAIPFPSSTCIRITSRGRVLWTQHRPFKRVGTHIPPQPVPPNWIFLLIRFLIFYTYRFDAAKTCPEPSTYVDKKEKVLKVKVCHLTQFALFWTLEAENGIFEFEKGRNGIYKCFKLSSCNLSANFAMF